MNYQQTIQYLYSRLPMFTRDGKSAIKPGLQNIQLFCEKLNDPHKQYKSIHVGGTNGKGSTSHMLAAILQTAGYKTGLYTSPHLRDFRERIRVNGQMISEEEVIRFVADHKKNIEHITPSFFETTLAMAFEYFAKEKIDIAVIEVGLGGRLDSTNIIQPEFSVITNIGYDHMDILGNTLQEIAGEKAGIIKKNTPVIIGQRQTEVTAVFIAKATEEDSKIIFASDEWEISKSEDSKLENLQPKTAYISSTDFLEVTATSTTSSNFQINKPSNPLSSLLNQPKNKSTNYLLDLTGSYQLKNLATVLSSVLQLRKQGFHITDEHLHLALKQVKNLTGLMGRWQTLSKNPLVICDTGHNEDGIKEVLKNIESVVFKNLHFVIGMVKDKDINKVLQLLPISAKYYFCQPNITRAKSAIELAQEANFIGLNGVAYPSVAEALDAAKKHADFDDLIFIGGSTFVVAEVV
jgi:dihydrofolate synthase/folylpolyglutamate synthase